MQLVRRYHTVSVAIEDEENGREEKWMALRSSLGIRF